MSGSRSCLFFLAFLASACGSGTLGLKELKGGAEIAVRRGSGWTTLSVKPPYIIGPRTNLRLEGGTFRGSIDNQSVRIAIDEEGAHGFGPFGPIAITIEDGVDALVAQGQWSGSRVHLRITGESLRGTIPVWNANDVASTMWCQYVLDTVESDGAWSGTSICTGLPEVTRIEIPDQVQSWFTRSELTVVLLALLSSPPTTGLERNYPAL
ncbi:MAG: hypothetical protein SGI86_17520 [Deltaproteobacteria bacterium]|nr:hypothetical protein [Deltaproteobacteria bacterium]